jgi:hypothetical protein
LAVPVAEHQADSGQSGGDWLGSPRAARADVLAAAMRRNVHGA